MIHKELIDKKGIALLTNWDKKKIQYTMEEDLTGDKHTFDDDLQNKILNREKNRFSEEGWNPLIGLKLKQLMENLDNVVQQEKVAYIKTAKDAFTEFYNNPKDLAQKNWKEDVIKSFSNYEDELTDGNLESLSVLLGKEDVLKPN